MNQLVAQEPQQPAALALLQKNLDKLAEVLPSYLDPHRMQRLAVSVFRKNPALARCKPASFVSAIMECGQLGLEPGLLNEASLVPYGDECTLVTGYKGLMKCAMRSGEINSIRVEEVKEADTFEEVLGSDPKLVHIPGKGKRGEVTHYYAIARMKMGDPIWRVMTREDIEEHRDQYAKGLNRKDSAWNTNFDAMAKKTVIRQLCKYLPASVELTNYFEQEKRSVATWSDSTRMERYHAIQDAEPIPDESELEIERTKLREFLATAEQEKVDISSVLKDSKTILGQDDVRLLRAVNDQLASLLSPL